MADRTSPARSPSRSRHRNRDRVRTRTRTRLDRPADRWRRTSCRTRPAPSDASALVDPGASRPADAAARPRQRPGPRPGHRADDQGRQAAIDGLRRSAAAGLPRARVTRRRHPPSSARPKPSAGRSAVSKARTEVLRGPERSDVARHRLGAVGRNGRRATTSTSASTSRWSGWTSTVEGQAGDERTRRLGAAPERVRAAGRPDLADAPARRARPRRGRARRIRTRPGPAPVRGPAPVPRGPNPFEDPHPFGTDSFAAVRQLRRARQRWSAADGVRRAAPAAVRRGQGTPAGRGDPRHRVRRAPVARRRGPHRRQAGLRPDRLRRRRDRPREVVRPGRCARRGHRPAGRSRHVHRRPDPPGLPRRRHRRLADRGLRRPRSWRATWSRRSRTSPSWPADTATASPVATRSTCSACRSATTTRRPRTSSSTRRCTASCAAGRVRRGRGVLGGQRRHRASGVPGRVRAVARRRAAPCTPSTASCRSCRSAPSTPTGTDALFSNTGTVGARLRPRGGGDEHHPADVPGRASTRRPAPRRYRRAPGVDRPRRLQQRVRPVERHVVRGAVLRGPPGPPPGRHDRPGRRRPRGRRRRPRAWAAVAASDGHEATELMR